MIIQKNEYLPEYYNIDNVKWETHDIYTISIKTKNQGHSGQFFMLSVPGTGEAAISVASGNGRDLSFTIRKIGSVTGKIYSTQKLGVRGPYGKGWPWKDYDHIVAVAGGIGVPPIRSLLEELMDAGRKRDVSIIYGARTPSDLVYKDRFDEWSRSVDLTITVDRGDEKWMGNTGFVTEFIGRKIFSKDTAIFIIGPPLMMKNSVAEALKSEIREENIFLSLERRMECGIGVCGHFNVGEYYVCDDGPIFRYTDVKDKQELFL